MIYEKIRELRERAGLTQSELAKHLNITRSSVNAWEMGISVPSTQYVIQLSEKLGVSTDYLLGLENTASVSVKGLTEKETALIVELIKQFRDAREAR